MSQPPKNSIDSFSTDRYNSYLSESDDSFGKQKVAAIGDFSLIPSGFFCFGQSDIRTYSKMLKQKGGISRWQKVQ
jgi:hypothetical protein